jgi:ABC-type lipoprotein release transport system permease subunit
MISKIYLILKEMAGSKFISFVVFCVILLSASAIISFNILSDNFNNYINNRFASAIPPDEIKVKPGETRSLFLFSPVAGKVIDTGAVNQLRAIQGVRSVDPILALTIPSSATIYFWSFQYNTDLIFAGASYAFVEKELKTAEMRNAWKTGKHEKGVPVLVPRGLIDSYNNGLAAANNLPEIVPEKLTGLKFRVSFGKSSVSRLNDAFDSSSVVAGYTRGINITGLVIPLTRAEEINKKFGQKGRYMFAIVKARDHRYIEGIKKQIKNMGYTIETGESLSAEIVRLKNTVNTFIALMVSLITILAIVSTALCSVTAVWSRIDYYRIMRVLGASRLFIAFTILVKFAVMGFLASLAGICAVSFARDYVSQALTIPGIKLSLEIKTSFASTVLIAGTLIPVIASLPAILRMFWTRLDRY